MKTSASTTAAPVRDFAALISACLTLVLVVGACKGPPAEPVPLDPPMIRQPNQAPPPQVKRPSDAVGVGDRLEIFVAEDESLNGIYTIREKGDIILPRLGRFQVAGMTSSQVESHLTKTLEESQLRSASVIVDRVARAPEEVVVPREGASAELPRMLAYFTGNVKRPGQHWITLPRGNPVGIYEAILITGGLARFANDKKVEVLRKDEQGQTKKMMLNLHSVREGEAPDPPLYEGDIIFVPEKRVGL